MCVYHMLVFFPRGGWKRALDRLLLELPIIVNCPVGAGNQTWFLCEGSRCSYPLSRLPSPRVCTSDFSHTLPEIFFFSSQRLTLYPDTGLSQGSDERELSFCHGWNTLASYVSVKIPSLGRDSTWYGFFSSHTKTSWVLHPNRSRRFLGAPGVLVSVQGREKQFRIKWQALPNKNIYENDVRAVGGSGRAEHTLRAEARRRIEAYK